MRKNLPALFISILFFCAGCASGDYRFAVEKNVSHVFIEKDGSLLIDYNITFKNEGRTIDVVDVGFPTEAYGEVSADIAGETLTDIKPSSYISAGVEVHLGGKSIKKGESATIHVRGSNRRMAFADLVDQSYVSVEFSPTWFAPEFVEGRTHLEVNIHFPPGVGPDEVRWHDSRFTEAGLDRNGRVFYKWTQLGATQSRYTYGVSFPRRAVTGVNTGIHLPPPSAPPAASHKGGSPLPFFIFIGIIAAVVAIRFAAAAANKRSYLPPEAAIEGFGANDSLSPYEAAVVLEILLDRVIALIVFGMLRKNAIMILSEKPFTVVEGEDSARLLDPVEREVLEALKITDEKARESRLEIVLTKLVRDVNRRLTGYSREETRKLYEELVRDAVKDMETDKEGRCLKWAVLDKDFAEKFKGLPASEPEPSQKWYSPDYRPRTRPIYYSNVSLWFDRFPRHYISRPSFFAEQVAAVTNPLPVSSGSSGRSCACACACAGCACACAGGGR